MALSEFETIGDVIPAPEVVESPGVSTANVTVDYGILGFGPASTVTTTPFNGGSYTGGSANAQPLVQGRSGVYSGSLSAQGNMVAMQLNNGSFKWSAITNERLLGFITTLLEAINTSAQDIRVSTNNEPYLTGYMKQYWRDPTTCTFGNDSAMPAITGVVPVEFTGMPGNLTYYIDLQLTRVSNSNYFDVFRFINTFNQSLSWLLLSNGYAAATNSAQQTNLEYYGSTDYKSFVSQGFDVYKQGIALSIAIRNQGLMCQTINDGYFGTPNAVVKTLLVNGLGYINNLSAVMASNGVTVEQIYSDDYTALCTEQLQLITNSEDLATIQAVLESTIPNISSPMDYCSIERSSGLPNDSAFANMAEFGKDLNSKTPNLIFQTGQALATLITNVQTQVSTSVEELAQSTSLLPQSVIDTIRFNLPTNGTNGPVGLLNIIGSAAGYLTELMANVNNGIAALYATSYGPRIRAVLTEISRYDAQVSLTEAEAEAAARYNSVPPAAGQTYWDINKNAKIAEYYSILDEVAADTTENIRYIFNTVNDNYNEFCRLLNYEYQNFNRASFQFQDYSDNSQLFNFVSSLPSNAADTQNLGTDAVLYGMAQPNSAGDLVKAAMANAKNNQILGSAGIRIRGQL